MKLLPAVLMALVAASASAQQFSFGVEGGVPFTQTLGTQYPNRFANYTIHTNPYVVGATAELRITPRFGIVADALMRHFRYDGFGQYDTGYSGYASRTTANDWEFPLLLRYRFRSGKTVSPFVNAGEAIDWLQHMREVTTVHYLIGVADTTTVTSQPAALEQRTVSGIVGGGGVDVRLHRLHLVPQVRYTYWTQGHYLDASDSTLFQRRNQVELLIGITF